MTKNGERRLNGAVRSVVLLALAYEQALRELAWQIGKTRQRSCALLFVREWRLKYDNTLLVHYRYGLSVEPPISRQFQRHAYRVTARLSEESEVLAIDIFECDAIRQMEKVSGHRFLPSG
jgi:hypothetical protein